jgi:hypothetical protein
LLAVEPFDRVLEAVERRHDLITEVAEHGFIVERGQRLILDDENSIDDALTLPEQHPGSKDPCLAPATNETETCAAASARNNGFPRRPEPREDGPQRIAKLLARAGVASRRDIERMIAEGRIALERRKADDAGDPARRPRRSHGRRQAGAPAAATRLFRFYKPQGTLTAARDPKGRATIYDKLPPGLPRVMPVGRLDFMTEGLLLLTNDGELKRKLELPSTASSASTAPAPSAT